MWLTKKYSLILSCIINNYNSTYQPLQKYFVIFFKKKGYSPKFFGNNRPKCLNFGQPPVQYQKLRDFLLVYLGLFQISYWRYLK